MSGAHQAEAAPSEPRDLIQVNPRWFSLIHLLSVLCGLDMRPNPCRLERVLSKVLRAVFAYYLLWELLYLMAALVNFLHADSLVDKALSLADAAVWISGSLQCSFCYVWALHVVDTRLVEELQESIHVSRAAASTTRGEKNWMVYRFGLFLLSWSLQFEQVDSGGERHDLSNNILGRQLTHWAWTWYAISPLPESVFYFGLFPLVCCALLKLARARVEHAVQVVLEAPADARGSCALREVHAVSEVLARVRTVVMPMVLMIMSFFAAAFSTVLEWLLRTSPTALHGESRALIFFFALMSVECISFLQMLASVNNSCTALMHTVTTTLVAPMPACVDADVETARSSEAEEGIRLLRCAAYVKNANEGKGIGLCVGGYRPSDMTLIQMGGFVISLSVFVVRVQMMSTSAAGISAVQLIN